MIDGVIFDLDGTLWDATEEICRCWQKHFPDMSVWKLKTLMGLTSQEIANKLGTDVDTINSLQDEEVKHLSEHPVSPYVGVTSMLQYLNTKNIPCFIVSNCQSRYIECFLHTTNLGQYFKDWTCFGDTNKSKGDNIRYLMERNNLSKYVVVVGDTHSDEVAAKEAEVRWFVWASYGFGKIEQEHDKINEPLELLRYV